jgi:glyoxylase-like metal-dependent hydrolase (beta-lactamase superfamily II)
VDFRLKAAETYIIQAAAQFYVELTSQPVIYLVKAGSLIRGPSGELLDARSSVTLVMVDDKKILIDTGLAGEETLIVGRLEERGYRPEDIDLVVNTHCHPDHCGCNSLFTEAEILNHENTGDGEILGDGIQLIATPGHTEDCISAIVSELEKTIVVAGDALPTLNNFLKRLPPFLNIDRQMALASISRIVEIADVVVPGHDKPFLTADGRYAPR